MAGGFLNFLAKLASHGPVAACAARKLLWIHGRLECYLSVARQLLATCMAYPKARLACIRSRHLIECQRHGVTHGMALYSKRRHKRQLKTRRSALSLESLLPVQVTTARLTICLWTGAVALIDPPRHGV